MAKENQESEKEQENNIQVNNPGIEKINAIRDIIFGHDMAEYTLQFESLKALIDQNKETSDKSNQALIEKVNQMELNLNNSLKSLEDKLLTEISHLNNVKTDRQQLGNLLEEIGKKIKE